MCAGRGCGGVVGHALKLGAVLDKDVAGELTRCLISGRHEC
jgi:hypothetical protein